MKKYFITGLVILLPLTLTLAIVNFFFNILTAPFLGITKSILTYFGLSDRDLLFFSSHQLLQFASQFLILVFLIAFTILLGYLARWFFIHYLIQLGEFILHRTPVINTIYKTCQDVITTIFTSKNTSFKQVVMIPYPNPNTFAIGFITGENIPSLANTLYEDLVSVFVPTTPNPTSGYLLLYRQDDIQYVDISVEDALKFIISCGVLTTPFKLITKQEALNKKIKAEIEP